MLFTPQLRAQTTLLPNPVDLRGILPARRGLMAWLRDSDGSAPNGFVAAGQAERFTLGPHHNGHYSRASAWWAQLIEQVEIRDQVHLPGTGLLALGSFAFSPDSPAGSTLIVPSVVVGHRDGTSWLTLIGPQDTDVFETLDDSGRTLLDAVLHRTPIEPAELPATTMDPITPATAWNTAVGDVISRIRQGEAQKVVLARKAELNFSADVDERAAVKRFHEAYPSCWTFAIDGLLGATPELLVETAGQEAHCRVLAGTLPQDAKAPDVAGQTLATSAKNLAEHQFAVDSVVEVFTKLGTVESSDPYILHLKNVAHLATDVTVSLTGEGVDSLAIAGALHPTAALGGTPREAALDIIREVEGNERDRYGAPVGWMSAAGDSEWCVALRCARVVDDRQAFAWAGGGIMPDSDPAEEFAETEAKFAPVRGAFNCP